MENKFKPVTITKEEMEEMEKASKDKQHEEEKEKKDFKEKIEQFIRMGFLGFFLRQKEEEMKNEQGNENQQQQQPQQTDCGNPDCHVHGILAKKRRQEQEQKQKQNEQQQEKSKDQEKNEKSENFTQKSPKDFFEMLNQQTDGSQMENGKKDGDIQLVSIEIRKIYKDDDNNNSNAMDATTLKKAALENWKKQTQNLDLLLFVYGLIRYMAIAKSQLKIVIGAGTNSFGSSKDGTYRTIEIKREDLPFIKMELKEKGYVITGDGVTGTLDVYLDK